MTMLLPPMGWVVRDANVEIPGRGNRLQLTHTMSAIIRQIQRFITWKPQTYVRFQGDASSDAVWHEAMPPSSSSDASHSGRRNISRNNGHCTEISSNGGGETRAYVLRWREDRSRLRMINSCIHALMQ